MLISRMFLQENILQDISVYVLMAVTEVFGEAMARGLVK